MSLKKFNSKISVLPSTPGVYFFKNSSGKIIYIGKAANLKNRVRQYFQKSRASDPKTDALINEIADIEFTGVESELDALFLEAELIRRYLPQYNILLRDDKSMAYVRINFNDPHPAVTLTRNPLDDKASYYGPFFSSYSVKKALRYLRKIFPYSTHTVVPKRVCLQYHLGLCPGLEENKTSLDEYRKNLKHLSLYLQGKRNLLIKELEREMKRLAKELKFEQSAKIRNQLLALKGLKRQIIFGDRELQDASKDQALVELTKILGLDRPPVRLEGYDISHMQGTDTVASMVVFKYGVPDRTEYRKFKLRTPGNDDFKHMNEALSRRYSPKHVKSWGKADLIIIDGGKGQLSAAIDALHTHGLNMPVIALAKKFETVIVHQKNSRVNLDEKSIKILGGHIKKTNEFVEIDLPKNIPLVKLLQRIRDESHRFAVSYHSQLKTKRQTASWLETIPGLGPTTRKKLIKHFGSLAKVANANQSDIAKVIGPNKTKLLASALKHL